ncbi:MAG: WXG100 family type VII secretion target [Phycisphaerales bacterium]|nr:WXG100 family type VII secretion target [Phycisphaerales bacterium]|tara:strand:+ start:2473 stop:2745 length:273 start_codon:yes stop_codon:yes gene_type:complete
MAKAIIDPEELKRFARDLGRFREELDKGMNLINARMNALGQTWRDQEHHKFQQEFEQTLRAITRFSKATEDHVPYLMRKAEKAQEYLDQG